MSDYKEVYEENKYILIGSTYGCLEDERWGTRYSPPKMIVVGKDQSWWDIEGHNDDPEKIAEILAKEVVEGETLMDFEIIKDGRLMEIIEHDGKYSCALPEFDGLIDQKIKEKKGEKQ